MKIKKPDLVIVEWEDAWGESGWRNLAIAEEGHGASLVTSVGFVIKGDNKGLSLAYGLSGNGMLSQNFIPRKMIKKITKIKY
jgi:hypothetical protein